MPTAAATAPVPSVTAGSSTPMMRSVGSFAWEIFVARGMLGETKAGRLAASLSAVPCSARRSICCGVRLAPISTASDFFASPPLLKRLGGLSIVADCDWRRRNSLSSPSFKDTGVSAVPIAILVLPNTAIRSVGDTSMSRKKTPSFFNAPNSSLALPAFASPPLLKRLLAKVFLARPDCSKVKVGAPKVSADRPRALFLTALICSSYARTRSSICSRAEPLGLSSSGVEDVSSTICLDLDSGATFRFISLEREASLPAPRETRFTLCRMGAALLLILVTLLKSSCAVPKGFVSITSLCSSLFFC